MNKIIYPKLCSRHCKMLHSSEQQYPNITIQEMNHSPIQATNTCSNTTCGHMYADSWLLLNKVSTIEAAAMPMWFSWQLLAGCIDPLMRALVLGGSLRWLQTGGGGEF